jgi:hypothetical protein
MQRLHIVDVDEDPGPGAAVAVVLGEMKHDWPAGDLNVARPPRPGLVLPVNRGSGALP